MAHRPSKTVRIAGRLVAKRSGSLFVRKSYSVATVATVGGPFPLFSRFSCYSWVNYRFSNNLPFKHVVPAGLDGDEPAVFDQNFGRVDCSLPVPEGVGSVDTNISRADGGFAPALK
jgi:hypothetical protein